MSTQGQTIDEANNFMALEPRLVELVRQAVEGMSPAVHVLTTAELADVKESAQRTPAVHVIYGGYRIAEDIGTAWELDHTWYVVAAVSNVATPRAAPPGPSWAWPWARCWAKSCPAPRAPCRPCARRRAPIARATFTCPRPGRPRAFFANPPPDPPKGD